ncbi:MAG: hypothetical protein GQ529_01150 [Methyloprofundus sp.]|nr:hypothetical protein [Methyloprofundus sp.]
MNLAKRFEKSKQPYFLDAYGWALLNNNAKEAIVVFQQVVLKEPEIAVFNYHLAVAYHKTNKNPQAIEALEKSLIVGTKQQGGFEALLKKN